VPPTPLLWPNGPLPILPGLLVALAGTGLALDAADGTAERINGQAAVILSVRPDAVTFQSPWDLPAGASELELEAAYAGDSPLVMGLEVTRALAA
jgi:hypothetical protein